jgi:hypothetical protein
MSELENKKVKESLRNLATPIIHEYYDPYKINTKSQEQEAIDADYKERLEVYNAEKERIATEERNAEISRTQDKMWDLYGILRVPRPHEILYDESHITCDWCGSGNVAYVARRTPNAGQFDKSIPYEKSEVDSQGNWSQVHCCIPPLKKNAELLYLQKRIQNLESLFSKLQKGK